MVKKKIANRDIKGNSGLNLEVDVNINDSLESAGRRASLFGRPIETRDMTNLI